MIMAMGKKTSIFKFMFAPSGTRIWLFPEKDAITDDTYIHIILCGLRSLQLSLHSLFLAMPVGYSCC